MKRLFFLPVIFIALQFSSCENSGNIDDIKWMIGQWQGTDVNGLVFHEVWENDGANSYTGSTCIVSPEGDTIYRETLKINLVEGKPYFVSTVPGSKGPVLFKMVQGDSKNAVFENREHAFPQSISYTLENSTHMNVKLEGIEKGQPKVEHLEFERVLQPPIHNVPDTARNNSGPKQININM
ncbi:MAG TPA: DUF6265 family protein [Bacteroidia bacterium]|nr:DUF6265 family protein [Bacteroidia bacterium]